MDRELDILFVGPWARIEETTGKRNFEASIEALRKKEFVNKIVYSSSDPVGVVSTRLFDDVASTFNGVEVPRTYQNNNTSYATSSLRTSPYIENVKAGLHYCHSTFVIRVRSDLVLQEIEEIYKLLVKFPNRKFIDYHPEHTLLIPFYFSDMFLAAKLETVKEMYDGRFLRNTPGDKKLTISPLRYLSAGFWDTTYQYPEVLFWKKALVNIHLAKSVNRAPFQDFITSYQLINKDLVLLDRNRIFNTHHRLNRSHKWSTELIFPWRKRDQLRLLKKHFIRFLSTTFKIIIQKIQKNHR